MSAPAGNRKPEVLFFVGGVSQYLGAALAYVLFDQLGAIVVVCLRVVFAAVILSVLRRPRWSDVRCHLRLYAAFGIVLAGMNVCFYMSLDRLPLGNAVAMEFLGPVLVAASAARGLRGLGVVFLAVVGVLLLVDLSAEGTGLGAALALAAGALWAGYIVLGSRVAQVDPARLGLTVAMVVGGFALAPLGAGLLAASSSVVWWAVALAAVTGLLSNVVPYSLDQRVLRLISRGRFALLQAMLPVIASLIGVVALQQVPSLRETLGIVLVAGAIAARPTRVAPALAHD